jgi:hypothetical protein
MGLGHYRGTALITGASVASGRPTPVVWLAMDMILSWWRVMSIG